MCCCRAPRRPFLVATILETLRFFGRFLPPWPYSFATFPDSWRLFGTIWIATLRRSDALIDQKVWLQENRPNNSESSGLVMFEQDSVRCLKIDLPKWKNGTTIVGAERLAFAVCEVLNDNLLTQTPGFDFVPPFQVEKRNRCYTLLCQVHILL